MNGSVARSVADMRVTEFIRRHPSTVAQRLADGSWTLRVPDVPLNAALWSKPSATVAFLIPAAFPMQRPDCFWTDADLRLRNGAMPGNTGVNPNSYFPGMLWFSYHPQAWDVRDTVETYYHLIQGRLAEGR